MSVEEKKNSNEKDNIPSSIHFLSQLKEVIHNPELDIQKKDKLENIKNLDKNQNIIEDFDKNNQIINELNNRGNEKENKENNNIIQINSNNDQIETTNQNREENNKIEDKNNFNEDNGNKLNNEGIEENISENKKNDENNSTKEINPEKNENNKIIEDKNEKIDKEKNIEKKEKENLKNKDIKENIENNVKDNNENELKSKISKESQKSKSEKEEKHKPCPLCLNNCIKWTLNAEIKGRRPFPKDFKSKYTFIGTSVFFKKIDFSILNTLHNSLSNTKWNISSNSLPHVNTQEILEHIKSESFNKLNNNSTNENKTPASPIKDNSSLKELLNINYPIDNTKFNYSIIDANLGIKDNLKNLFLLEFDLSQMESIIEDFNNEIKEKNKEDINEELNKSKYNKDLRDINDDCVEREIYFILNGTFHGNRIFKNDLNFSVEYREFIKSVQFRLQNYQNKIIEISKKIKGKKNLFHNMQTDFFGKVLTNINLGIEFSKPQSHEIIQTNFNSIVNSHIELNKILIELTIPNIFINNNKVNISNIFEGGNEDTNSISTKKTSISSPKKEEDINKVNNNNNFNNKNNYSDNHNFMFNSNMTSPNNRTIGLNRSIPASPHINDYQKLLFQKKYSPLMNNNININMNNNFLNQAQNSFFSATPNYPRSPALGLNPQQIFCSPQPNTYSPLSMMIQMPYMGRMMQQPMSINSPFNMSNYSSPYMGNGINKNNNSGLNLNASKQQRKNSDCFNEKIIIDNPMNTIGRKIYNSNHQTPIMLKRNEEESSSRVNLNQYMSPKSMGPGSTFTLTNLGSTSFNLNNQKFNGGYYQLNPMNNINQLNQLGNLNQMGQGIPMTIRKKIVENAQKEEVEKINKTLNSMNRVRPSNNNVPNININNMPNINSINNFNNSNANNNIRNNNNKNNMTNFNINTMKNIPNIPNMHNIQIPPNMPYLSNIGNKNNFNNMNSINNINKMNNNFKLENEEKKERQRIKTMFIMENQNKTNLEIFLKSVTPIYKKDIEINFLKLKIKDFFNNFKKISLHGLKNTYYSYGELLYIWYSLSLSSFSIKVTNKQLISQIFEEVKKKRKKSDSLVLKEKEEISIIESLYTLYFTTECLEISFNETNPVHFRKSYYSLIKIIMNSIPFFDKITVEDINLNDSFFAILFSSFKASKPHNNHSSFVVYYHFTKEILQENKNGTIYNNEKYFKQTIVGVLPIKISKDFLLQRISFNNHMIYKPIPIPPYGYFNSDTLTLKNMIYSIINEVTKHTRENSYDYELFIKLNKHNYNNNN